MTRKDYELIASSIHRTVMVKTSRQLVGNAKAREVAEDALRLVAIDLAATLGNRNPNFDRARFLKAAGVSA
jgi:hypothetical protein